MANDGKDYEKFVQQLHQALIGSEEISKQKNIIVEINKIITDNNGIKREFDLYWEYELAGIVYKTIIECKDYKNPVSIEKIDALIGKTKDIPDLKPVFATKTGYQSGAKIKAEQNRIELLIVREQCDEDWQDDEGNPYIKIINIMLNVHPSIRTTSFIPEIDGDWAENNSNLDLTKPLSLTIRNDQTYIENVETGEKYSVMELESRVASSHKETFGTFTKREEFKNAFIHCNGLIMKMLAYTMNYTLSSPIKVPIQIDFSKEMLGVIEYLHRGSKTAIFSDKIIKDWRKN